MSTCRRHHARALLCVALVGAPLRAAADEPESRPAREPAASAPSAEAVAAEAARPLEERLEELDRKIEQAQQARLGRRPGHPVASRDATPAPEWITEPRPWHLRAVLGLSGLGVSDPSFDAVAAGDLLLLGDVGLEAEWRVRDRLPLVLSLGYSGAAFSERLMQVLRTHTLLHSAQLGLQLGYRLWDALMPYLRSGLTLSWANVRVVGELDAFDDWAFTPGGYALAGIELSLPRRWIRRAFRTDAFSAGVKLEVGYLSLGAFRFDGEEEEDEGLRIVSTELGGLVVAGFCTRLGTVVSF